MKKIVLFLLSLTALVPISASARPYHLTPVSWIVATRNNIDVDDHYVTIVGHVTRRIGDEEYWFTDGTGSVRLDSENFDLPIGKRIVVGGRIDQAYLGFGHIEVDVRRWHYAPARNVVIAPAPPRALVPAPVPATTTTATTPTGTVAPAAAVNATPLAPPVETK
jgi:hypothetical protein